jgi:hypothetical protein
MIYDESVSVEIGLCMGLSPWRRGLFLIGEV